MHKENFKHVQYSIAHHFPPDNYVMNMICIYSGILLCLLNSNEDNAVLVDNPVASMLLWLENCASADFLQFVQISNTIIYP